MKCLKKIFFYFLLLTFIQGSYGYLYPDNGWPTSFMYKYEDSDNPIENMFKDEKVARWFNKGYNPDSKYNPINKKWHDPILILLEKLAGFSYFNDYVHDYFSNHHKALVVPSGELMGDEDSDIIKNALNLFVESGGTLVVLAQQYGEHFEKLLPVPEEDCNEIKNNFRRTKCDFFLTRPGIRVIVSFP